MSEPYSWSFKLKPLPKPEYKLHRELVKQYKLESASELFAAALRLTREVLYFDPPAGEQWFIRMVDEVRSNLDTDVKLDLPEKR